MPKPSPLQPGRASRTLAVKLGRVADNVRQIATKLGVRPIRVFLVWTIFDGKERGEGIETELARKEILPTPLVLGLDAVAAQPFSAGKYGAGSVRVGEISVREFDRPLLKGERLPMTPERPIGEERIDFFYELVDDDRSELAPYRARYRITGEPDLRADEVQWVIVLERSAEDRTRQSVSQYGTDPSRGDWTP